MKLHSSLLTGTSITTPHTDPPSHPATLDGFEPVSSDVIQKIILNSPDKQCELDPIPTALLKKCVHSLLPIITKIVNTSITSGNFPDEFKQSIITPLLKKPTLDKENLSNYRPVSNLSFLSKLTERIVKLRLESHFSANSLFNKYQSAYKTFHSTETTLLSLHDHLIRAISQQKVTGLCLLDLSAAFDTIDHQLLLHRLQTWFGIQGPALNWFKSYLSSRNFTLRLHNIQSSVFPITCGVPQGSVLGPLLFTAYTTPLSQLLSETSILHHLYADDTQLYISFSPMSFQNAMQQLQETISSVSNWMSSNLLCLNQSKSEFMIIGLPKQLSKLQNPLLLMPDNTTLLPVKSARNLGFQIDSNLTLADQISSLTKSCFYHLRDLRRVRKSLDFNTARLIATAIIHSKLDYCNSLYLNLPSFRLNRLQLIQNAAARAISNRCKYEHITPVLKSLHWLKIRERIQYKIISLTYQAIQTHSPLYLAELLKIQNSGKTRSSNGVSLIRPSNPSRLKITDRSFYHQAPAIWNNLPIALRPHSPVDSKSPPLNLAASLFHSKLKTYLFQKSYPPDQ